MAVADALGRPVGRVVGLHAKPETPGERGLPKVDRAFLRVGRDGVEGDFNRWRHEARHGDPDQALLVLPNEVLEAVAREGWPVRPGHLGENVTTAGIPYADLAPPARFRLGSCEIATSKESAPCEFLATLPYVGAERLAAFERALAHRRGWYARVLTDGEIRLGDPVLRLA